MRRPTFADLLVLIAAAALVVALVRPSWERRELRALVRSAAADVELVATAARAALERDGRWPTTSPAGSAPPELAAAGLADSLFTGAGYELAWTEWQVVDSAMVQRVEPLPNLEVPGGVLEPAPPQRVPVVATVGAVALHASEEVLLAELYERFSAERPILLDGMLLIVLPERPRPAGGFSLFR